ncbi:hypothetical protein K439DRAFT_1639480 [Ramaria rubella]|nr:hypothetical protein K439DRAFT_1639480 [Ramaria rubella]
MDNRLEFLLLNNSTTVILTFCHCNNTNLSQVLIAVPGQFFGLHINIVSRY